MIPLHQSHASDLSWQNLYEVPKGETWRLNGPIRTIQLGRDMIFDSSQVSIQFKIQP